MAVKFMVIILTFFTTQYNYCISSHDSYHGKMHTVHDDHVAFLGHEMAKEFEKLTPEESKRRLR